MLGHLKAEDFVNLMEGAELPARRRHHLASCPRCLATWESVRSVHAEITPQDLEIPEPDWSDFRASVRDELLSRSVQRQSVVRRWTGWDVRPAVAWALSIMLAIGITTLAVLWRVDAPSETTPLANSVVTPAVVEPITFEMIEGERERALFDDVVSLDEDELERFRQMLESSETGSRQVQ
jgi:hypothetical protein